MKLAMAQMLVEPGQKRDNLARAEQRIESAAVAGARLVVLPEALALGWTHPSAREAADELATGETCRRLCAAARRHGLFVCFGFIERAGDRLFNSAVLVNAAGAIVLHHRKIHELEIAHDLYARGDRLAVAETPWGRIGLMICADGFAPGQCLSRALAMMGASLIVSPCAWAVPADHDNARDPYGALWIDNYGPVAREYGIYIAGVSNVGPITAGPWAGRQCIGNSLLIGRNGQVVVRGPYGEAADAILFADLPG